MQLCHIQVPHTQKMPVSAAKKWQSTPTSPVKSELTWLLGWYMTTFSFLCFHKIWAKQNTSWSISHMPWVSFRFSSERFMFLKHHVDCSCELEPTMWMENAKITTVSLHKPLLIPFLTFYQSRSSLSSVHAFFLHPTTRPKDCLIFTSPWCLSSPITQLDTSWNLYL